MPFKLKVSGVKYSDTEIAISGKVVEGAFGGPEGLVVTGEDGSTPTLAVTHHSMVGPVGWPVLPDHDTLVTLSVGSLGDGFRVDQSQLVIGVGALFMNEKRTDISSDLSSPVFLAMQLSSNLEAPKDKDPSEWYFGVSAGETERCYNEVLHSRYHEGVWPYIELHLDNSRSVEIEFAASIQFQDRFWAFNGDEGVLLGYNSGHFSLPAFRFEEILWIHDMLKDSSFQAAATLLLMQACYLDDPKGPPFELVSESFLNLPFTNPDLVADFADTFLENLTVSGLQWRFDSEFGWINNWIYSQRNPEGYMSILDRQSFDSISEFFH